MSWARRGRESLLVRVGWALCAIGVKRCPDKYDLELPSPRPNPRSRAVCHARDDTGESYARSPVMLKDRHSGIHGAEGWLSSSTTVGSRWPERLRQSIDVSSPTAIGRGRCLSISLSRYPTSLSVLGQVPRDTVYKPRSAARH